MLRISCRPALGDRMEKMDERGKSAALTQIDFARAYDCILHTKVAVCMAVWSADPERQRPWPATIRARIRIVTDPAAVIAIGVSEGGTMRHSSRWRQSSSR